jgi:hypothetical protein
VRRLFARARVPLHVDLAHQVLADLRESKPAVIENFRGDRVLFAQEPEQQMLGADVPVAKFLRFLRRICQHALGLPGERQIDTVRDPVAQDRAFFDHFTDRFDIGVRAVE